MSDENMSELTAMAEISVPPEENARRHLRIVVTSTTWIATHYKNVPSIGRISYLSTLHSCVKYDIYIYHAIHPFMCK